MIYKCKPEELKDLSFKRIKQILRVWEIQNDCTLQKYYLQNYFKLKFSEKTRWKIELVLELHPRANYSEKERWMSIGEIFTKIEKMYDEDATYVTHPKIYINELLFPDVNEKFGVNVYDMIKESYEKDVMNLEN